MNTLLALVGLTFAGDVEQLGDSNYAIRGKAYSRLAEAGIKAYPWLVQGMLSECYQRQQTCQMLVDKIENRLYYLIAETTIRGGYYNHAEYWSKNGREYDLARHILKREYHPNPVIWVREPWVKVYSLFEYNTSKQGDIAHLIMESHNTYNRSKEQKK